MNAFLTRRQMLMCMAGAGMTGAMAGFSLPGLAAANLRGRFANSQRVLVLIELKGGNDGLNTVIPYTDPLYYDLRPRLAIARDQVIPLSNQLALNPAMASLRPLWDDGEMAIALGLGYAQPNRSHFRSIEIWDSASDANQTLQQGWLGSLPDAGERRAVVLGKSDGGPLLNSGFHTLYMDDPDGFVRKAGHQAQRQPGKASTVVNNPALQHLLNLRAELGKSAQQLGERLPAEQVVGEFPGTPFGRALKQAARLILAGGMGGRMNGRRDEGRAGSSQSVIKLSLGSFDTHARQRGMQDRLLGQLAEGVAAMRLSLMRLGLWEQTLLMTYSEFGRRVRENGSGGTDHGTAAAHFMWGGRVKGGFYGQQPSLHALQQSDLVYTEDFRRLYATAVEDWWGQTPSGVLAGYRGFRCIG